MPWLPHLTVACMVECNGKLLFVEERSQGSIVLNQPAGHLEDGETLAQAALRETLEESGCTVELEAIQGIYKHRSLEKDCTYIRVCYLAKLIQEDVNRELDQDIIRTAWLSPEEALQQEARFRSPLVKNCIQDFLNNKTYPLELVDELIDS